MKEFLKSLYNIVILFFQTVISVICVLLFSRKSNDRYFKEQRKKREIDDECYILCNGPSLSQLLDQEKLILHNSYVVNYFATTSQYTRIRPNNYIVLDNRVIGKAVLSEEEDILVNNLYTDIIEKTTWPLTFFYPNSGIKKYREMLKKNLNITVVVFNMTPVSGFKCINHWLFRHSLGMPWPENISNAAVFCALNSGYKRIYLYGVEHSWMKNLDIDPETHKLFLNDGHFYKKNDINWLNRGDYLIWLGWTHRALQSHFELRTYADAIGAKVINKTANSFIEAYEFDEY